MSVNGTNFVEGSSGLRELTNQLDEEKIKISTSKKGKGKRSSPYGSHFGGVHETMIKSWNKAYMESWEAQI